MYVCMGVVGIVSCRALQGIVRTLAFILCEVRSQWRMLKRGLISLLSFKEKG